MPMFGTTKNLECFIQSVLVSTALICGSGAAFARTQQEQPPDRVEAPLTHEQDSTTKSKTPVVTPTPGNPSDDDTNGRQPKRILGIIPNYRAVSANTQVPPLALKGKLWLATQDSFDYSSFILAGMMAGTGQVTRSTPEFGQEASGYGRYFWHSFTDQAVGNYFTEAIVPAVARQDPATIH